MIDHFRIRKQEKHEKGNQRQKKKREKNLTIMEQHRTQIINNHLKVF